MLLQLFHKRGKRGFTLVELLIVVAIIGVLSTIGVPTFRRMIQKSKKSEAKVNLGGVYTTEAAFNAEYNAYGNNLGKMGYEIEGNPASLIYTVGFFGTNCAGVTTIYPNSGQSAAINAAFPAYYSTTNLVTRTGYTSGTTCYASSSLPTGVTLNAAANGQSYTAGAAGYISPSASTSTATQSDVWTINNARVLSNTQDGTL